MGEALATALADAVNSAIAFERERCALIADAFEKEAAADEALVRERGATAASTQMVAAVISRQIAAAIRKGNA